MTSLLCCLAIKLFVCVNLSWGYGLMGCSINYGNNNTIWCHNRNIKNVSRIIQMIPCSATKINLSKNQISTLPHGAFEKFFRLKNLGLDQNVISTLRGGEFKGLGELISLNLSHNKLSDIRPEAFQGLKQLKILSLYKNHVREIPFRFLTFLPQINALDLSQNQLKILNSLCNSSSLQQLNVSSNRISQLDLSGFPALEYLDISSNPLLHPRLKDLELSPFLRDLYLQGVAPEFLTRLSAQSKQNLRSVSFSVSVKNPNLTVCNLLKGMLNIQKLLVDLSGSVYQLNASVLLKCPTPKLLFLSNGTLGNLHDVQLVQTVKGMTKLYIIKCGLESISATTFRGLQTLQCLHLNDNDELDIQENTFSELPNLGFLSLDRNGIRKLNPAWFHFLKKLKLLSIMKNKITEFPPHVFSALCNLTELFLRDNVLKVVDNQPFSNLTLLEKLDLSLNIISYIDKGSFKDLLSLRHLDLSGNRISKLNPGILQGLGNVKNLVLYNNRLHFDEKDSPFKGMTSLAYIELRYQGPGGQGMGNIGQSFFEGVEHLKSLSMGYSISINFHPEAFSSLVNLEYLYIGSITMNNVNLSALFRPLKSLRKLTLYKTDLDSLPSDLMPPGNSLTLLLVQSNHLRVLEESLIENLPMLHYLNVIGNPLSCTCQNAWFKNWSLYNPNVQVPYIYDLHCDNADDSPNLWEFDDKACRYDNISLSLFLVTSILDLLFLLVGITWQTQRSTIRYLFLLIRSRVGGHKRGCTGSFTYDAFISYSSQDEPWVMRELVSRLEGNRFRLCLHHRDFRPGAAILDNIEGAIYSARRTLCVVSRDFLRSEWCALEFQLASLRLLCEGSDVLLLVFLEEIPSHCLSPFTRLRKMVRKNTYLLWPEDTRDREAFWVRLQDSLREGVGEEEEVRGEEGFQRLLC